MTVMEVQRQEPVREVLNLEGSWEFGSPVRVVGVDIVGGLFVDVFLGIGWMR